MSLIKLIKVIEKEIAYNKNILSNIHNSSGNMDRVMSLVNINTITSITNSDIEILKKLVDLNDNEIKLLEVFSQLGKDYEKVFKNIGFDENQKNIIDSVKNKLELAISVYNQNQEEEIEAYIKKLKILLTKLNNNDLNLITEIVEINNLMNKYNIPLNEQTEIYTDIQRINIKVYSNYKYENELNEDIIIDEESMIITDLDESFLKNVFDEYELDLEQIPNDCKFKLLKYGNIEKIRKIIDFIVNTEEIRFLLEKDNSEILTKILLYSDIDKIKDILFYAEKNGIKESLREHPSIFFPTVREVKRINVGKNSKSEKTVCGAYYNYINNIKLFEEMNIPIKQAYDDCSCVFIYPHASVKKNVEKLKMYNISLIDSNGNYKKGLSILRGADLLKTLDCSIELGHVQYLNQNLSRLISFYNIYRIKYAKKLYSEGKISEKPEPYKLYPGGRIVLKKEYYDKESPYGDREEDTFELYKAINVNVPDKKIYDGIINNNDNDVITGLSINDPIIKQLDHLYIENDYVYNMNGIRVSRLKVLRIFETLTADPNIVMSYETLLYIITIYSMLDEEEIECIKECLNQIKFGKIKEIK